MPITLGGGGGGRSYPNGSKQRVIANRKPETIGKARRRSTTQRESEMPDQAVQTGCPASHGTDHTIAEALGENLSAAMSCTTDKASDSQMQFNPSTRTRQIGNHPRISTMNPTGSVSAFGAPAISALTVCGDNDRIGCLMHRLHVQFGRDQIGKPKLCSHGAGSP
jgi:hypothetical protein